MKSLNLIPFHYPWAWEMSKDMLANTWTPFEHEQGNDRRDLREVLSDYECTIFTHALAYLTTADVQIGDNADDGTAEALARLGFDDAPEIRGVLRMQAQQEWIHTMSYQHQLESILSLPPAEQQAIYRLWETEPAMREKVVFAAQHTASLRESDDVAETLASLFWYYQIYEGALFMGGFNPVFALTNFRGAMHGTTLQFRYIRRDESEHIRLGVGLLREARARHPEAWTAAIPLISDLFVQTACLEAAYADWLLPEPILGYSAEHHMTHFRYLCNQRAIALAIPEPWPDVRATPFPWLSAFTDLSREANFFEDRAIEYQRGRDLQWPED